MPSLVVVEPPGPGQDLMVEHVSQLRQPVTVGKIKNEWKFPFQTLTPSPPSHTHLHGNNNKVLKILFVYPEEFGHFYDNWQMTLLMTPRPLNRNFQWIYFFLRWRLPRESRSASSARGTPRDQTTVTAPRGTSSAQVTQHLSRPWVFGPWVFGPWALDLVTKCVQTKLFRLDSDNTMIG